MAINSKRLDKLISELQAGKIDKKTFKKGLGSIINEMMIKSISTLMPMPIISNQNTIFSP
jgi:hypothetical protein